MSEGFNWTQYIATAEASQADVAGRLEAVLSDLFDRVPVGLFVLDNETGRLLLVNREFTRITGYSLDEARKIPFTRVVAPEDLERVREFRRRRIRNDITLPEEYEMLLLHRNGERRAVVFNANPIPLKGVITGALRDVTDLKLRADPVLHVQRMDGLASLAAGLASEFNNLLAAIGGHADLALTKVRPQSRAAQSLTKIQEAVGTALSHVKDLLSFARSSSNAMELVDVVKLVNEVSRVAPRAIPGKPFNVTRGPGPSEIFARGDHGQLEQALLNVLINALEALPDEGGNIFITVAERRLGLGDDEHLPAGDYVAIDILDDGHGIAPEDLGSVFQPFFTTHADAHHTGLGLSATLGIVEEHGGTIHLDSELSSGTRVSILLPRETGPDYQLPAMVEGRDGASAKVCVLVVDDQDYVLELFNDLLEALGYEPACYSSAQDALADLDRGAVKPEVMVADLLMPGMDGRTFIREVRARNLKQPIIVTSGFSAAEEGDRSLRDSTSGFLRKPFRPDELQRLLRLALGEATNEFNGEVD